MLLRELKQNAGRFKNTWLHIEAGYCCSMLPRKAVVICLASVIVASVLIVLGILLICLWPALYDLLTASNYVLRPDSQAYQIWKRNPMPLDLKIYLFNWTNAATTHEKPRFEELGPYVFDETKEKSNITWNSNETVSFKHVKTWWYNSEKSKGRLDDMITSVNPTALSAAYSARNWGIIFKKSINVMLGALSGRVYSSHTAGEVLFDGYQDTFLDLAKRLPKGLTNMPPMEKFGWFHTRNGSEEYEGAFNMDTGESKTLGELYSWKYMTNTPYYDGACGKVRGSAGEFFPRNITKDTILTFFNADLCRYVEMEFEKEEEVQGVLGYKFVAGERFLDNGTKYPENKCFCDGDCMPSGALNASRCRYGSPAFISLPHFYGADPHYLGLLEGLNPQKEIHQFFMVFEPKTAIPLKVSAKLQLNLLVQPIDGFTMYSNIHEVYVPVLWFTQQLEIPSNMAFLIRILVDFEKICVSIGCVLLILGIVIEICAICSLCRTKVFRRTGRTVTISKEEVPLKDSYREPTVMVTNKT